MRIAQVVLPNASEFERKSQRIDLASLAAHHEVVLCDLEAAAASGANVVHLYGSSLPAGPLRRMPIPYVASTDVPKRRLVLRRPVPPRFVLSPVGPQDPAGRIQLLPEAVEDEYFTVLGAVAAGDRHVIGSFGRRRPGVANASEQAMVRIGRVRDDVTWRIFDNVPSPGDLAGVEVWVDPTTKEEDFDGFVAEAIAAGKAVVASRTTMNSQRLEKGRTGFLVPPGDSNELVHAILAALFKPEVARQKIEAARQTAGKFHPRQRLRVLDRIYDALKVR